MVFVTSVMQHIQVQVNIEGREEDTGILCISDDHRHWIEIRSRGFGFEDIFIPVIFATDIRRETVYTCIQCHLRNTEPGSTYLNITELIIDEHSPKATEPYYKGIRAEINGLAYWSGAKRAIFGLSIDMVTARTLPEETFTYRLTDDVSLVIDNWCHYYTEKQVMSFEMKSQVTVTSNIPASRIALFQYLQDFIRIQSLFVDRMPSFSKVKLIDPEGEQKELLRSDIRERDVRDMFAYMNFHPDIKAYFGTILKNYQAHAKDWRKVFDLLNESNLNKTKEVSFLNITTALEIMHRDFVEPEDKELMKQYNDLLLTEKVFDKKQTNWRNATRYYHLIERTHHLPYFQRKIERKINLTRLMRNTRNWYTHYDDETGQVWTPAQLIPVNNLLAGLTKGVILQLLGLPDNLINKLVSAEAHMFFHNYEANPYSLAYREGSFGDEVQNE